MKPIRYEHTEEAHRTEGPSVALPRILEYHSARSLLDVGCGTGSWLRAAQSSGISDLQGLDGIALPAGRLEVDPGLIRIQDLRKHWDLKRTFDLVLCVEVAEHLDPECAPVLIQSLTQHGNTIVFSAASPFQTGDHHVNCQWPDYWQKLFNERGYSCDDALRWKFWDDARIDPWYRQNLFVATSNPAEAGSEPAIKRVFHPDLATSLDLTQGAPLRIHLRKTVAALAKRIKD